MRAFAQLMKSENKVSSTVVVVAASLLDVAVCCLRFTRGLQSQFVGVVLMDCPVNGF